MKKILNVIILGFSFMFIFTAFQTCGMIQKTVIESIKNETSSYKGDGYLSLAVIYAVFAAANWIAPTIICVIGPKYSMLVGGIAYGLFIANFLYPMTWALYVGSVLVGLGAALIWTGQGNFLTINSDPDTISRNSGLFWAMLQCSILFGNIFVYFEFNQPQITEDTRMTVFGVLTGVACLGILLFLALRGGGPGADSSMIDRNEPVKSPKQALVRSLVLMRTKEIILLSLPFLYTGLELSFFSGVYGTCISFTEEFGDVRKSFVGLSGICIGAGEIIGGAIFGIMGKRTNIFGRDPVIILGYIVHMVTFFLIFINFPSEAPIKETNATSYISSSLVIALICAFTLGFGDSCFNTQIYSILGFMFPEDSAPAFALFKFIQSVGAAVAFFYSTVTLLQYQLIILVITGTVGTIAFCQVEWLVFNNAQQGFTTVNSS